MYITKTATTLICFSIVLYLRLCSYCFNPNIYLSISFYNQHVIRLTFYVTPTIDDLIFLPDIDIIYKVFRSIPWSFDHSLDAELAK